MRKLSGKPIMSAMPRPRLLTKTKFKLGAECASKLYYTGKPEYANKTLDDNFLAILADGGHQVGALACLAFPDGIKIDQTLDQQAQADRTAELLVRDEVTIFEAAFIAEGLHVKVDILTKRGERIELQEVKAKSYDSKKDGDFRKKKSAGFSSDWLPYLHDIAFQRYVFGLARPDLQSVSCFLVLADKTCKATVNGLNQRFAIVRGLHRVRVDVAPGTDAVSVGASLLARVSVDGQVNEVINGEIDVGGARLPFAEAVRTLARAYQSDQLLAPNLTSTCAHCEFKTETHPGAEGAPRSGFHECWSTKLGWTQADFEAETVLDLWNFKRKDDYLGQGIYRLTQMTAEDLRLKDPDAGEAGLTHPQRQWLQVQAARQAPTARAVYLDDIGLGRAADGWKYPYHFIDFETCMVPIPFTEGRRPYEQLAFQFSHHVMDEGGRIRHATQFLSATPGVFPNYEFLRALRDALSLDRGTVFRWSNHEQAVLNQIAAQLKADPAPPADSDVLTAFVAGIVSVREGEAQRDERMVDLCKLAEQRYFHPSTKGSNSLKKVLPALMSSSELLRDFYGMPVYGGDGGVPSLNFAQPMTWWKEVDGIVCDPYQLLPPMFPDFEREDQDALDDRKESGLRDGGAAMAAYVRLQSPALADEDRRHIENALLRYCELDTLAMVMAVQAWRNDVEVARAR